MMRKSSSACDGKLIIALAKFYNYDALSLRLSPNNDNDELHNGQSFIVNAIEKVWLTTLLSIYTLRGIQ